MGKGKFVFVMILVIVLWGTWFFGTQTFVKTERETFRMKNEGFGFGQVYVDTRSWGLADYLDHPHITKELLVRGYADLIKELKDATLDKSLKEHLDDASKIIGDGVDVVSGILEKE